MHLPLYDSFGGGTVLRVVSFLRGFFVNALELRNVTKRFGEKVVANQNVNLDVRAGEILAILGENGSGKTTLMNMVAGIYHPDEGEIFVNGERALINSPRDAFDYRIGMIHQHFKLVDVFTATENIVLGINDGARYNLKAAMQRVSEISNRYGFDIPQPADNQDYSNGRCCIRRCYSRRCTSC